MIITALKKHRLRKRHTADASKNGKSLVEGKSVVNVWEYLQSYLSLMISL